MNEFSLEYVQKLRIHELRDFARQIGVSSPTTMKKEELIDKIQEILGTDSSSAEITNKEPVDFFDLLISPDSDLVNELIAKSDISSGTSYGKSNLENTLVVRKSNIINPNSPYSYPKNDFISFNLQLSQRDSTIKGEISQTEGYIDIHPSGYGIVRCNGFAPSSRDCYITLALVKKYKLRKGDFVRGKVKFILENKPRIMFDIISVDSNIDDEKFVNFDDAPYLKCGEDFYLEKFENLHIARGERLYFNNMSIEDAIKLGYDIVDENGANVKLINLKALPEESFPSHQKMQIINCQFNKTEQETVETVAMTIERAKREFENNMPNVIMIYNFSELIRMYNVAVEGFYVYDKFNAKAINQLSNIMCSAKFTDPKKSITLICIDKKELADDVKTLVNSEFMPLFNKKYDMSKYE